VEIFVEGLGYNAGKEKILNNINFSLPSKTVMSITGQNGSGKTTLLKCLSTLILPNTGSILFDSDKLNQGNKLGYRKKICLMLESSKSLYANLTLLQNIRFFLEINNCNYKENEGYIDYLLNAFSLEQHKNKLVSSLSRGMQQKTAITIALVPEYDLVLLDEPHIGLDQQSVETLKKELLSQSSAKSIIFTTPIETVLLEASSYNMVLENGEAKSFDIIKSFDIMR